MCAVHSRAFSMRDILREVSDAHLELGASIVGGTQVTSPGRLAAALDKVRALLAQIGVEEKLEREEAARRGV